MVNKSLIKKINLTGLQSKKPIVDYYYFDGFETIGLILNKKVKIFNVISTQSFVDIMLDLDRIDFLIRLNIGKVRI